MTEVLNSLVQAYLPQTYYKQMTWRNHSNQNVKPKLIEKQVILHEL